MADTKRQCGVRTVNVQLPIPAQLFEQVETFKKARMRFHEDPELLFTRDDKDRITTLARTDKTAARLELEQLYRVKLANHVNETRVSRNTALLALIAEGLRTLPAVPERYTKEQISLALK